MNRVNNQELEIFKYFLECYFNPSTYYSELEQVIEEFNSTEAEGIRLKFRNEIKYMKAEDNMQSLKEFIRIHGMRTMTDDKVKLFIDYLNKNIKK